MVREMNDFITRNKKKPFFIYWALNSPHYPLQGDAKWREYYKDLPSPRGKYNAFVSTLDERIGQMLEHLEAMGLTDNTLVIFQSDHGHSTEERTFNGGGSAGIYRGAKGCLFRRRDSCTLDRITSRRHSRKRGSRAIRFRCRLAPHHRGPLRDQAARSSSGREIDQRGDSFRIRPISSRNLLLAPRRRQNPEWVVRDGDWKLLGNPEDRSNKAPITQSDQLFLANLSMDPTEMTNLATKYPEVVERLSAMRANYLESIENSLAKGE